MLNSYYAELLDVTDDNRIIRYGYTFKDKNMREAKLHATNISLQMGVVPLPTVWRISHANHVKLLEHYALPSPHPEDLEDEAA